MDRHRIFDSVVTRLLFLGLCIVILGAAVLYYTLSKFLREDLSSVVAHQQLALATYVARDIDYKIVQRQTLLTHLATALPEELLTRPQALRAWLQERYEYQPLFSAGLFITDARGVAIADYPVLPDRLGTSYSDRDYIRAAVAGQSYVGRPVVGRIIGEPVLPIAAPKKNAKGDVQAILVGVTTLADKGFLDSLLQSRIGAATGGFLLISPRDQLFVASSQPDMVLRPTPPPGINALHDRAMDGFRGTGVTLNAKGIEEVSAMVSVPSTGWFVVARLPTSEAFATVERTQSFLLKISVLIILAFVVISSGGLYLLFRPLFRAAEHAHRMTQGEVPFEPLPVVRNDEVGYLISSFNRLLVKLRGKQAELVRMAHHDVLTGLPNRALLYDRTQQVLAQARRRNTQIGLLFMDLDGFKRINDTLGHEAGDEALRQTAKRFNEIVRQDDTLARVGGDEFVLLLGDLGEDAEAAASTVAAKCIQAMQAPFLISGTPCSLGVSIGIAFGNGDSTLDALLLTADQAMYQAKEGGRDRFVTFKAPAT
ncbi:MAG: diguanylate cyclase [Curvibacter sp. GWA2_64_110]|nr:MAG: diguanylate cyclase [Curvibacter sp. GWA2_64_110]HCY16851.1 GGDEF domain-containing protein [Curvibacter sp.]